MKKKMVLIYLSIFIVSVFFSIYFGLKKHRKISGEYISVTVSSYSEDYRNINTTIYSIDLQTYAKTKIFEFPLSTQYPLGVYDANKEQVYYTHNDSETLGDQLYSYDIKTKEIKQQTKDLNAINYIFPAKEKIILIANFTREMKLISFDYSFDKYEIISINNSYMDEDIDMKYAAFDPVLEEIIFSYSYEDEAWKAINSFNTEYPQKEYLVPANHFLYMFSLKDEKAIKICETDKKAIHHMSFDLKSNIIFSELYTLPELIDYNIQGFEENYFIYNKDTKKIKPYEYSFMDTKDAFSLKVSSNNSKLVYYRKETEGKSILYEYNIETSITKEIFSIDSNYSYINNFWILNKR